MERLASASVKARAVARPKSKHSTDSIRGGRQGEDYGADELLLKLDSYNKNRLVDRLGCLVNQHRWGEAAGVASTLLRAISWWSARESPSHRPIFTAVMEILRHVENTNIEDDKFKYKIKKVFNSMYTNQPSDKSIKSKRLRGEVQLDLAIFLYAVQDFDGAYNALRPIVDAPEFRDCPAVNLTYGLVLHQLWHDLLFQQFPDRSEGSSRGSFGDWQPSIEPDQTTRAENMEIAVPAGAETEGATETSSGQERAIEPVKPVAPLKRKRRPEMTDDEEFWEHARVLMQPGAEMDTRLFPIRLPCDQPDVEYLVPFTSRGKELRQEAVHHLQQALAAAPQMTQALLPLVQLLLSVGDVDAANRELEICYRATKSIVPLSIRAMLLESLCVRDAARLAHCYEEIQFHNPSSVDALTGLMGLYNNGEYEIEAMIQAIATHLDAEHGSLHVWRMLAGCLHEVAVHAQVEDKDSSWDILPEDIVDVFIDRSIWWRYRHFSASHIPETETDDVKVQIVTYKAACALHIYGRQFGFVNDVSRLLEVARKKRLSAALSSHSERALCLLSGSSL